jgi:hypothetical protein
VQTSDCGKPCGIISVRSPLCLIWQWKKRQRALTTSCLGQTRWEKKEHIDRAEASTENAKGNRSHFAHLLFSEAATTNVQGSTVVLQHYYGYYRRAIRDALSRSSRKPFQCGGLQGYDQLVGISQHLSQRRMQSEPDPYLDQVRHDVQRALRATASQAESVRQARTLLTQVEHYLAGVPCPSLEPDAQETGLPISDSKTVQRKLEKMISDSVQQPNICPLTRRLVRKWRAMSETWLPDILHCYDVPGLPRSNLDLESAFGTLRRDQRRISGCKETTPLRVFGPGEILLLSLDEEEILPLLQSVPVDEYWSQRRLQEEREEPRRWLIRLHRDPAQALDQVDEQFYMVVNAQARTSADAPLDSY